MSRRSDERGVALVVAVLVILVLTVMGIAAVNSSILETAISGYGRESTRALWRAEECMSQNLYNLSSYTRPDKDYAPLSVGDTGQGYCPTGSGPSCGTPSDQSTAWLKLLNPDVNCPGGSAVDDKNPVRCKQFRTTCTGADLTPGGAVLASRTVVREAYVVLAK